MIIKNEIMNEKQQKRSIYIAIAIFILIIVLVGLIGYFTISRPQSEDIQGEIEVEEYRVSSKVPGRIVEICVKEGDYVHAGDTLAIIDCPDVEAKKMQAESAEDAATALYDMAKHGARQEQITAAYQLWQQAKAGAEIAKKSYDRLQRLFDEGVVSQQKRDEAFAGYKALEAQEIAAKSQYEMAMKGARQEEKRAAEAQVNRAKGAISEVNSYINETVQTAQMDGEVSSIYPKIGELIGTGSPIMTISMMDKMYATFNIREDKLAGVKIGDTMTAFCPAFNKEITLKVYNIKDQGSYAAWKATKSNGQYDLKTFQIKAQPTERIESLRPGMTLILK